MLTDPQKSLLVEKLDRAHIKTREQSGRTLSYVEAWHVISEANRIFGFDGWTRETTETLCVHAGPRKVGRQGDEGWGVSYIAKVRIRVGEIVRDGTGAGHGIDRDLGLAHESAIKEAESDAMKRAFSTWGNQFGLALYDKAQEGVERAAPAPSRPVPTSRAPKENHPPPAAAPKPMPREPQGADDLTVKTVYSDKTPYAVILSDGRKLTFFSETLLEECRSALHAEWPVRVEVEERWKDGKKYTNLKAIWPSAAPEEPERIGDDEPPPYDGDPDELIPF